MLCHCCRDIDLDKLISENGLQHHVSMKALELSAENGCELCEIIKESFEGLPFSFPESENFQIICQASKFSVSDDFPHPFSRLVFSINNRYSEFEMGCFTEADSPLSELISGRPLAQTSHSDNAFDVMSNWMDTCLKEHRFCYNPSNVLPSRIIDVGRYDGDVVRLVISDGLRGQWVILSHCWGSQRHGITTIDNMEDRQRGINVDSLPLLYRDAIAITRKLGYQYLWIDSLCIIQDSLLDWRLESMQMDAYYSGAVLNISAVAASNSSQGIFLSADKQRDRFKSKVALNCHSKLHNLKGTMHIRNHRAPGPGKDLHAPLLDRAWVLQEYVLCPRVLQYWDDQMKWQCNTIYCEEEQPDWSMHQSIPFNKLLVRFQQDTEVVTEVEPLNWWYFTVNDYMGRTIKFPDDRLPGIAGIAKEFAARTGLTYRCGLWEEDIIRGLGWNAYGTKAKIDLTTCPPSWSWASLPGLMPLPSEFIPLTKHQEFYCLGTCTPKDGATLVEVSVVNEDDDPFGQVKSARLMLRGKSIFMDCGSEFLLPFFFPSAVNTDLGNKSEMAVSRQLGRIVCFLDEPSSPADGYSRDALHPGARYFQLGRWEANVNDLAFSYETTHALILEPVEEGGNGTYRRIGIAELPDEVINPAEWLTETVTIV